MSLIARTTSLCLLLTAAFAIEASASDMQEPQLTASATIGRSTNDPTERKETPIVKKRETSPLTRVGVQSGDPLPITLNDAIQRALQNNNDISISRTDVQIAETSVRSRKGIYDPVVSFSPTITHNQTTGNPGTNDLRVASSLSQFIQPGGGSVTGFFNNNRTENAFAQAQASSGSVSSGGNSAIYTSSLGVNYTQPLWRNFNIDSKRQAIKVAKKQLAQSDTDFRLQATSTIASVQRAYWDLVFSLRDQQNQVANLNLAKENLRQIEARIAAGAAAPLAKAEVETELANREGALLSATQQVSIAENSLKLLIFGDPNSAEWGSTLVPTDKPATIVDPADLDVAMKDAMDNRFELRRLKLATEINKIDLKYLKNQTKPQIDLNTSFSLDGLSRGAGSTASTFVSQFTGNEEILRTKLNTLFAPGSQLLNPLIEIPGTPQYYIGGFNRSWANMFRSDAPNYSVGVTISFPLRNRTAKANYEAAKLTTDRLAAQTRSQEQAIIVEVRNAVQGVETARQRVLTARRARESAETQLDGERKLYDAGRSTSFLLFQRENSLANARNSEIRAETDLNKAIAELQRVTATSFRVYNITLDSPVEIK
ncbi:MAG: TolC family protein [Blastocatellia bacterium]|nr:TolC family protein [Blastocatellia bacterium]